MGKCRGAGGRHHDRRPPADRPLHARRSRRALPQRIYPRLRRPEICLPGRGCAVREHLRERAVGLRPERFDRKGTAGRQGHEKAFHRPADRQRPVCFTHPFGRRQSGGITVQNRQNDYEHAILQHQKPRCAFLAARGRFPRPGPGRRPVHAGSYPGARLQPGRIIP